MSEQLNTLAKGIVGVSASAFGFIVSMQNAIQLMQFVSLSLGSAVAAVTLYKLLKKPADKEPK